MTRIEKSIEIKASAEKIFPLIDWDGWLKWYDPFKKVEWTSKDTHKLGSTVHVTIELAGLKSAWDGETTEYIENEKIAWRSIGGGITGFGSNSLSPVKGAVKVTLMMDYDLPYSLLGKMIDKLRFHKAVDKSYETGLKKLKAMAEM